MREGLRLPQALKRETDRACRALVHTATAAMARIIASMLCGRERPGAKR